MASSTLSFEPSCPSGGTFYACGNATQFVGCCTTYPCTSNGCFAGNLRPASFLASAWGTFSDQQCESGLWYTCKATTPPFMGCCASNPCAQGACPDSDLRAGFLSQNPSIANEFDPQPPLGSDSTSSTLTASSTSSSSSFASSAAASATSTPTPPPDASSSHSVSTTTLAGAVAGGACGVLLIIAVVWFILRRRRRTLRTQPEQTPLQDKSWPIPVQNEFSPYMDDTRKLPMYSSNPASSVFPSSPYSPMGSPRHEIHEAQSRELSYVAYNPHRPHELSPEPYSPTHSHSRTWGSERMSGVHSSTTTSSAGLGVRMVNSEHDRAELH